jgi:hypothetical protein
MFIGGSGRFSPPVVTQVEGSILKTKLVSVLEACFGSSEVDSIDEASYAKGIAKIADHLADAANDDERLSVWIVWALVGTPPDPGSLFAEVRNLAIARGILAAKASAERS